MEDWDKYFSRNGCPYYLNLKTMKSQWEHPHFAKILAEASDYNDVIYAAYRTALKLLHIRNKLQLQTLTTEKITCALADTLPLHSIRIDEYLTLTQLNEIVMKLYLYCDTAHSRALWTGSMSSCLLYFFDGKKRGTVNTLSVLVFLSSLCGEKLSTKYSFIFQYLNQHDLVGAQDISHLKKIVFNILSRLHEDKAYRTAYEGNGTTMTKDMFLKWLLSEPKFVVWLSTLHRIDAADKVRHAVKCYRCKDASIVGLRYRCLQCFNVDMCFQCFARIPAYGKHDKSHSIEEYCVPSNKMEDVKAFIAKLRNNVKKKAKKARCIESDLTARRQPATVWHDPKLSEPTGLSLRNAAPSYTPVNSPAIDRRPRPISHMSEGQYSVSQNHTTHTEGESSCTERYSQSLPRKSRLYTQNASQSSQRASNRRSYHAPHSQTHQFTGGVQSYSTPYKETNINQLPGGVTPIAVDNHIPYNNQEDTLTPHHTTREGYNRELYAPSQAQSHKTDTIELDFYSTISRHATPYKPITVSTNHYHIPIQTRQSHSAGRSVKKSNNSTYSEDEGVVMTSESDSSVSQYPTYENRDSILAARQPPPSAGRYPAVTDNNSTARSESQNHHSAVRAQNGGQQDNRKPNFEYTKYSWDKTQNTGSSFNRYSNYSQPMDETRYFHSMSTANGQNFDGTYRKDLYQAVGGVQAALSPMIRTFQV